MDIIFWKTLPKYSSLIMNIKQESGDEHIIKCIFHLTAFCNKNGYIYCNDDYTDCSTQMFEYYESEFYFQSEICEITILQLNLTENACNNYIWIESTYLPFINEKTHIGYDYNDSGWSNDVDLKHLDTSSKYITIAFNIR